jgi:glyoxylase-like metal-dependent hydrolase (beta-lactamase superfamily II)/ferredoxin
MAMISRRLSENVDGDFYVDSSCIDCDLCRQIAPDTFADIGDQSAVFHQPDTPGSEQQALKALVTCPTASIGTVRRHSMKEATLAYPEPIDENVYFCGYASESSYGASSYLIVRDDGNVLVDSPRFAGPLVKRIQQMGGIRYLFLTHRDDVADHAEWAKKFDAQRIMHQDDAGRLRTVIECLVTEQESIADDLLVIPTPGHTRGHMVLLYRNKYLFTGDHLWWSPNVSGLNASRSVCWYSWPEQVKSLQKLLDYQFEWVLPGHGRRFHADAQEMRHQLEVCIERSS